jgi:hypothetical protein
MILICSVRIDDRHGETPGIAAHLNRSKVVVRAPMNRSGRFTTRTALFRGVNQQ